MRVWDSSIGLGVSAPTDGRRVNPSLTELTPP
jgi:hypothetical protein